MRVSTVQIAGADRVGAMRRLFSSLSLPEHAARIAIKPNLCDYRAPETGAVAHPEIVAPLLEVLREHYPKADISLCENDSSDTLASNIWRYVGLDEVAAKYDARCVDLSRAEWVEVPIDGLHFDRIEVPVPLLEADLVINHPKLKTHGKTRITCALKNLFGCYRPKDKGFLHRFLDEAIVDINLAIRPHMVIVDADLCVEGNRGPTQGLPKRLGLLFGGSDPVAVDACCAKVMGFRPRSIGHIRRAARAGLGTMGYVLEGDLRGRDLDPYRFKYSEFKHLFMRAARRVVS